MKKSKKTKIQQLFKKFNRKKWVIQCKPEFMEDFLDILEEEGIHWFNDDKINAKKNTTQFIFDSNTHRFEFKHNKLRFNPQEYYPSYHYRTVYFEEFFDLYYDASLKDNPHYSDMKTA